MNGKNQWSARYDFWRSIPQSSHALFLIGAFFMFVPAGLLTDIAVLGANRPARLAASALLSGGLAISYILVIRRRLRWLPVLIALHVIVLSQFDRIAGPVGLPLTGEALRVRLAADVNGSTTAILVSFVLLSHLIRREGTRYVRAHAEIALARDIHRLLVPRITQRIGRFDFRGVSLPSGEVGGDLIDLVVSPVGWTSYVADVSGHGVAAGLLMGMVKSAVRTQLRADGRLDALLNTLNTVLFDLKGPTMFVTFAAVRCNGASDLQFTLAGHLPILHYRSATNTVDEVSILQLSLAMFPECSFKAADVPCAPGDLFVVLTDGLTEVFDAADREFGLERVKSLIRENALAPLDTLEERLLAAVRAHGPQLDDQTLLLIRRLE
jgi:serine phosphatase RsbU (regulator of sigma subunit)